MPRKKKISDEWLAEIIRDTEHYYQGEMQQDARASWLLGTNSALVVVFVGLFGGIDKNSTATEITFVVLLLSALFLSSSFAVIALMPFKPSKLFKIKNNKMSLDEFIKGKFRPDGEWSDHSLEERIFHHYKSHLERNQKKSQYVTVSSITLMAGLLVLFFFYLQPLFKK